MDNPLRGLDPVTQNVVTGLVLAHVAALVRRAYALLHRPPAHHLQRTAFRHHPSCVQVLWCMLACCSGPSKRQKAE